MSIGIEPLIDCVFKRLFGSEHNKNLLLDMVNAILEKGGEPKVVEVEIMNPYNPRNFVGDKMSIVDIKARTENNEWIIVEVQVQMSTSFPKRLLYYWARSYQDQINEGDRYYRLQKVTLICISKQELPIGTKRYWNHFRLLEQKDHICLCPDLSIYTIELACFPQTEKDLVNSLEKWSYLLKYAETLDSEDLPVSLQTPLIQQAVKEMQMFTQNQIERELYESRRKALMDKNSLIYDHYQEGLEKGLQKGIEKGLQKGIEKGRMEEKRQMARQMLAAGLVKAKISEISGLSIREIENL